MPRCSKNDTGKGFKDRYGEDYKDVIFGTATDTRSNDGQKVNRVLEKETFMKIKKRILEKHQEVSEDRPKGN